MIDIYLKCRQDGQPTGHTNAIRIQTGGRVIFEVGGDPVCTCAVTPEYLYLAGHVYSVEFIVSGRDVPEWVIACVTYETAVQVQSMLTKLANASHANGD